MKRRIEAEIFAWKMQAHRKPLVLMGARQVGKTWLMEDFARKNFKHAHVIDFREHPDYGSIFMRSKDPADLLPKLSAVFGQKIDIGRGGQEGPKFQVLRKDARAVERNSFLAAQLASGRRVREHSALPDPSLREMPSGCSRVAGGMRKIIIMQTTGVS